MINFYSLSNDVAVPASETVVDSFCASGLFDSLRQRVMAQLAFDGSVRRIEEYAKYVVDKNAVVQRTLEHGSSTLATLGILGDRHRQEVAAMKDALFSSSLVASARRDVERMLASEPLRSELHHVVDESIYYGTAGCFSVVL